MPQAFGIALTNLHHGNAFRADRLHFIQQLALDAFFQHRFEFETGIKMVFDRVLGGVGDQHNLVNPRRNALIDDVLISGLSTSGSISFGMALVAGNIRVPKPATGITAFLTLRFTAGIISSLKAKALIL